MKLLYLSRSRYGGWVTFTSHLYHGLLGKPPTSHDRFQTSENHEVIRITNRSEKTQRDMGNYVPYRNMSEEDVLEIEEPILITAVDKHHRELAMKLLGQGAYIVIHDPTELRNPEFREFIDPKQVIVIRKSMLEHMSDATYIPHPYMAVNRTDPLDFKEWNDRPLNAISVSRLDFDKNSDWLFEANRKLPPNKQITIRGSENRMYTKTKIVPKYPEYIQDSNRSEDDRAIFKLDFRGAVNLCKTARYMTDFSVIKGDGGGTQYTFLEAIDAGTICLLHRNWIKPNDSMKDKGENQNCISFPDWKFVANFLEGKMQDHVSLFIRNNSIKLLTKHDAVRIAAKYARIVI